MTWIFIEPNDVLMFRDGRPFSAGQGHSAISIFPPTPLTMQGVLRSWFLAHSNVGWEAFRRHADDAMKIAEQIGWPPNPNVPHHQQGTLGRFSMAGPFLCRREQDGRYYRYVPLPADVVVDEDSALHVLQPEDSAFEANWTTDADSEFRPLWTEKDVIAKKTHNRWLQESVFQEYLQHGLGGRNLRPSSDLKDLPPGTSTDALSGVPLFTPEPRFGIAVDYTGENGRLPTGRTRESMLYRAIFVRPYPNVGLLVQLDEYLELPREGTLAIGGEQRSARFTVLNGVVEARLPVRDVALGKRIKVVLLTPAYFERGWKPRHDDWSGFFAGAVHLVSVALKRPVFIGGWDVANRSARTMYPYVAPGSVYYFESADGSPIRLKQTALTQTPATGFPEEQDAAARMGFGQIAVGIW